MRVAIMALTMLAATALPAAAQSRLDEIITRGTLRVGLTGDYKPFSSLDKETGKYSGLDVDMAELLAKALGVKLEIVPTAWAKLLPDVTEGKFDVGMGGISINLDRAKVAFFSTPVMRTGKTPIARCENKDKFTALSDIDKPGVKVITNPGGTNERYDRANLHNDELVAGHADLMITDSVETRLQQKLHPELCAIHPDAPFDFGELGYLLPRDVPLQQYVDIFLHTQAETGAYQRLVAAWLQ